MKLISKFHDYYDPVLKMGRDESIVYIRHTKEIECDKTLSDDIGIILAEIPNRSHGYNPKYETFNPILFFFCGKIYLGYDFDLPGDTVRHEPAVNEFLYSAEDVEARMELHKLKWEQEYTRGNNFRPISASTLGFIRTRFAKKYVGDILKKYEGGIKTDFNIRFNSPVLLAYKQNREIKLVSNPVLKDYNFMRLFNPYAAFQEISMYMGNVLGTQQTKTVNRKKKKKNKQSIPTPKDDKVDIERHGFDYKYGFRKPPGKKKRKKNDR